MEIGISRLHFPVTTLGPGKRIGIWFQGCSIHCEGCISADTWQFNTKMVDINELKRVLKTWLPSCDGITITGGEPFDQQAALFELLTFLRPYNLSVLVYSGYSYQKLKQKKEIFEGLIDVLISEPYDYKETQTKALLGSDNQKIHLLTSLGEHTFSDYVKCIPEKKLDVQFDDNKVWMAGIPIQGMKEITKTLQQEGVDIKSTQAVIKKK
ncbi:4Fe-4S single cluster domain-containing protein [Aquimarina algiphila]|uniref:4Fe-4S single cluster domain-containing protein n=1 Tax=Aquimarina algiphila TaxID=2047982 RepID=UPI00233148DB|nr:4Fe-4S single cluster domain-containing protein [Aquimarina algiphila]